jgi:hypothetical protein
MIIVYKGCLMFTLVRDSRYRASRSTIKAGNNHLILVDMDLKLGLCSCASDLKQGPVRLELVNGTNPQIFLE